MSTRRTTRAKAKPVQRKVVKRVVVERPVRKQAPKARSNPNQGLLRNIGMGVGGLFGPAGAALGGAAGSLISAITGFGDYKVSKNVLNPAASDQEFAAHDIKSMDRGEFDWINPPCDNFNPVMLNKDSTGGVVIRRREYITDIITSSSANTFKNQNFFINPAQSSTFAWLNSIAMNYEEWAIEGMLFEFRSTSSDALNSVNTALGTVIMATNYNAASPNFVSKAEMEEYQYGQSNKPSINQMHFIECEHRQSVSSVLYCRPGSVPTGQDQRLYDWGNFQIATTGFQGTSVNIGELWVSYQVALLKPKLYQSLGLGVDFWHFGNNVGVTSAAPLGTPGSGIVQSSSNYPVVHTSGVALTLPISQIIQTYCITARWVQTSAASTAPSISVANGNVTALSYNTATGAFNLTNQLIPAATEVATQMARILVFQTVGGGLSPVITFGTTNSIAGSAGIEILLMQIPNGAN